MIFRKISKILSFLVITYLLAFPVLCMAQGRVTLVVTRGFSSPPLVQKKVTVKGRSCMEILKRCARVETAYGGGFVVSINGIKGGKKDGAWFYYVNGLMADVGADRYIPRSGDIVQWDYHPWTLSAWVSAIIGSYPQPFLSGGCQIFFSPEMDGPSVRLTKGLKKLGIDNISQSPLGGKEIPAEGPPLVIIGTWDDLREVPWMKDIIKNRKKAGLFLDFGKSGMSVLNMNGKTVKTFSHAGAIVALKLGYGASARALWIVTGTEEESVIRALELLMEHPQKIAFLSGAAVTEEGMWNVPWQ